MMDRVPRPGWQGWLVSFLACLVLVGQLYDTVSAEEDADGEAGVINFDVVIDDAETTVASDDEALAEQIALSLAAAGVHGPERFQEELAEQRIYINALIVFRGERNRSSGVDEIKQVLRWLSLVGFVLLLGLVWAFRHLTGRLAVRLRFAWRTFPAFSVAAASVVIAVDVIGAAVIDLQVLQITLAAAGGLAASLTDATIHWLTVWPHPGADSLIAALTSGSVLTLESLALLEALFLAAEQARASVWLSNAGSALSMGGHLLAVYGPAVAIFTLFVAARILFPRLRAIIAFPFDQVRGRDGRSPAAFLWEQVKLLWLEVRFAFWMVVFLFVLLVVAGVLVRLVAFPIAWIALDVLTATFEIIKTERHLPDVWVFFSGVSLGFFALTSTVAVILSLSVAAGQARWMLRVRLERRLRFRDFPAYWQLVRATVGTVLRTVLAGGMALSLYLLGIVLVGRDAALWLPTFTLGPVMLMATVRLRVWRRILAAVRTNVLPQSEAAQHGMLDAALP